MNIAIVGATGMVGLRLVNEAVARHHTVTGICRHPENLSVHERVKPVDADVADTNALTHAFRGMDAILHSYTTAPDPEVRAFIQHALTGPNPMATIMSYQPTDPAAFEAHVQMRIKAQIGGTKSIIAAAKAAGVRRILAVGGGGSLMVNGVRNLDRPEFPRAFAGGALSTALVKDILKAEPDIDWTVLCPPMSLTPGTRTGAFRLGLDDLLVAEDGSSRISAEDFAVAMIDELERPRHTGRRFTVAY